MGARLKLIVAYDGRAFAGWQSQASGDSIQDRIEAAFRQIVSAPVRVHGAGRTDAGVHAFAQCAHVDVPHRRYTSERWILALNGLLPPTIRVMRCSYVGENFHARFSAKGKKYRYRLWNAPVLPPVEYGRAWHVARPMDFDQILRAAKCFRGQHDFAAFAANRGTAPGSTIRLIRGVDVRRQGRLISIDFEGDGFLYKMVRLMVGALVRVGLGEISSTELCARLDRRGSAREQSRLVAPAEGLFLLRVRY